MFFESLKRSVCRYLDILEVDHGKLILILPNLGLDIIIKIFLVLICIIIMLLIYLFTYYLSSDETSDKFCAHTQFNNNEVSESLFEIGKLNLIKKFNNYNCNKYTITPKEGTVLIFPSSLLHSTLKKENIGDRYTIPGDIKLSLKPEYNLYHQSIPHPSQWLEL